MYHSPVLQRSPTDDDDRLRRDNMAVPAAQPPPTYTANSPPTSRLSPYSPTSRSHHHLAYGAQYSSRSTASIPSALPLSSGIYQGPRHGPSPSPISNGLSHINTSMYPPRESSNSTYYDPTSEHREGTIAWGHSHSSTRSPHQVCTIDACKSYTRVILLSSRTLLSVLQNRDASFYTESSAEPRPPRSAHHSPVAPRFSQQSPTFAASHAHPPSRHSSVSQSPIQNSPEQPAFRRGSSGYSVTMNGTVDSQTSQESRREDTRQLVHPSAFTEQRPTRTTDPMSFSSILSNTNHDSPVSTPQPGPPTKRFNRSSKVPNGERPVSTIQSTQIAQRKPSVKALPSPTREPFVKEKVNEAVHPPRPSHSSASEPKRTMSDKENERTQKAMAEIDAMELSDVETPVWETAKQNYVHSSLKRLHDIEDMETSKRKVN